MIKRMSRLQRYVLYLLTWKDPLLRLFMLGTIVTPFLIFLVSTTAFHANAQQQSSSHHKIGKGVIEALQTQDGVNVIIAIKEPFSMEVLKSEAAQTDLSTMRKEINDLQDKVLHSLDVNDYIEKHRYQAIPALAGKVMTVDGLAKLAANPNVIKIDLDVGGKGSLANSAPFIGADLWHEQGVTGNGVVVAVLDSGIDTDHSDLADDLIAQECFLDNDGTIDGAGLCPNGSDRQSGPGAAEDGAGHGTATSGVITSKGTISAVGVAPDADIVSIKVLDDTPFSGVFFFFSEIVAALDFIINNRPDVATINMSLGTFALFDGDCDNATAFTMAGASAINMLRANGVIAFASSGNDASATQMSAPACISNVISVGATDLADNVAGFTNSNASTDIMAPGVNITSTAIGDTTIAGLNGTSFASPHAAGCAALFIEAGIAATPNQIETFLESSPVTVIDPKNDLAFPRIDCTPPTNEKCSFVDVPPGYWAEDYICAIFDAGITTGCSQNPLRYCPLDPVTREQMAAFIIRAVEGEPDDNLCATGSPFSDVSPASTFCKYIKRLSELEITKGCGGGKYCPKITLTREQMAAFIIRAVEGEPDDNLCATGSPFSDVSSASMFCKYIKRLSELGITTGCGGGKYCPSDTVTRAQMAAFLARAFLNME